MFHHLRKKLEEELKLVNIVKRQQKMSAMLKAIVDHMELLKITQEENEKKRINDLHHYKTCDGSDEGD